MLLKKDTQNKHFRHLIECHDFTLDGLLKTSGTRYHTANGKTIANSSHSLVLSLCLSLNDCTTITHQKYWLFYSNDWQASGFVYYNIICFYCFLSIFVLELKFYSSSFLFLFLFFLIISLFTNLQKNLY